MERFGPGGIQKLEVQFDGAITLLDASQITVVGRTTSNGIPGGPVSYTPTSVTSTGNTLTLNFVAGLLPDETCYTISVNPPDGSPAALVDDISLVYRPELQLSETQCITPS